ncbi:SOS response-associated peptidase family protein [Gryllotalpicola protaetiae]|uniref:Abasic site processing protein n=1 Tax=Gryllotalpicola protaetiae TaxID=2419771 RepID=A0A387BSL0_9MICO|nr:SOS response-associated peptidase family protein [Gryllotalpicola protaetiae]AYG04049.1 DUF159 family protein [Gryllotalpicola protaetiae]
MCASYGLGGGGHEGDPLPSDPDLAPLDERVELSFDFGKGWGSRVRGKHTLTGRNARNLNPMFRRDDVCTLLDMAWFKLWPGGKFDTKANTFNARAENLVSRWSGSFKTSRGLVPADWFDEKGSQFTTADGQPFMIATVWNQVHEEDGNLLTTYALVTRPAAGAVATKHDRMPLLLPPELWETWIDPHEVGTRQLAEAAVAASNDLSGGVRFLNEPDAEPGLLDLG